MVVFFLNQVNFFCAMEFNNSPPGLKLYVYILFYMVVVWGGGGELGFKKYFFFFLFSLELQCSRVQCFPVQYSVTLSMLASQFFDMSSNKHSPFIIQKPQSEALGEIP